MKTATLVLLVAAAVAVFMANGSEGKVVKTLAKVDESYEEIDENGLKTRLQGMGEKTELDKAEEQNEYWAEQKNINEWKENEGPLPPLLAGGFAAVKASSMMMHTPASKEG